MFGCVGGATHNQPSFAFMVMSKAETALVIRQCLIFYTFCHLKTMAKLSWTYLIRMKDGLLFDISAPCMLFKNPKCTCNHIFPYGFLFIFCLICKHLLFSLTRTCSQSAVLKEAIDDLEWPGSSIQITLQPDPPSVTFRGEGHGDLQVSWHLFLLNACIMHLLFS